jgi:hypothetical protein
MGGKRFPAPLQPRGRKIAVFLNHLPPAVRFSPHVFSRDLFNFETIFAFRSCGQVREQGLMPGRQ